MIHAIEQNVIEVRIHENLIPRELPQPLVTNPFILFTDHPIRADPVVPHIIPDHMLFSPTIMPVKLHELLLGEPPLLFLVVFLEDLGDPVVVNADNCIVDDQVSEVDAVFEGHFAIGRVVREPVLEDLDELGIDTGPDDDLFGFAADDCLALFDGYLLIVAEALPFDGHSIAILINFIVLLHKDLDGITCLEPLFNLFFEVIQCQIVGDLKIYIVDSVRGIAHLILELKGH